MSDGPRILVIDNYDSFTYNLVQAVGSLGAQPLVYRNDKLTVAEAQALQPDLLLISPGPGTPLETGVTLELFDALGGSIPTLGVCLGHQAIAHYHGATVQRASRVMHGKTSPIIHLDRDIFSGLDSPFTAARYHSLIVDESTLPEEVVPTAWTAERELMGLSVPGKRMYGVQFHPESFLTGARDQLLQNFLDMARQYAT